jgi:hypothetical protein
MSAITSIIEATKARTASQDAAQLAQAARRAMGALQWDMAAALYTQAADALPLNPHTSSETITAQAHRRSARHCTAMAGTQVPPQLIKDAPDYRRLQREAISQHERECAR